MQKDPTYGIRVWFWQRNDLSVPDEVQNPASIINPISWGVPQAWFQTGKNCDYESHFNGHEIVFDLTFCVSILLFYLVLCHLWSP